MSQRLSRKQIKRDEFMETLGSSLEYVRGHAKSLLIGAAGVVLLALLAAGFFAYQEQRERKADAALAKALATRQGAIDPVAADPTHPTSPSFPDEAARRERSKALFEEILRDFGRTDAAEIAAVYQGQIAADEGDYSRARSLWGEFLRHHSNHVLAAEIQVNLMVLDRAEGKGEELVTRLRGMLSGKDAGLPRDLLWYQLAVTLERLGRQDEAVEAYRQIVEGFSQSVYAAEARARTGGRETQPFGS